MRYLLAEAFLECVCNTDTGTAFQGRVTTRKDGQLLDEVIDRLVHHTKGCFFS